MHDPEVVALQGQRKLGEEFQEARLLSWGCATRAKEGQAGSDGLPLVPEPVVAVLSVWPVLSCAQQVELVIPQQTLGSTLGDLLHHTLEDRGTIGSAIDQISDIDQPSSLWMGAARGIAQATQELFECMDLSVHISNDIDGTLEEVLDEG